MRIALLGATGRTGRLIGEELLARDHDLTVLARDPARVGGLAARVQVVVGDSTDAESLARLVTGAEVVVSALGPTDKSSTVHRDTTTALLPVMQAHDVLRYIGISGAGVDVPGDRKSARDRAITFAMQRFGGAMVRDKTEELDVLRASDLRWTLVRPPRLTDGPATGHVQHDAHRSPRRTSLSRADLAQFVADVVEQDLYERQAPLVAGG